MVSPSCNQLDAFLNRELSPCDEQRFQHHVQDCPTCNRALELDQHIAQLLLEAHAGVPIPGNLLVQVDRRKAAVRRRTVVVAPLAAAASLLVAGTLGTWWSEGWGTSARDPGGLGQVMSDDGRRTSQQEPPQADRPKRSTPGPEDRDHAPYVEVKSLPDVAVIPIPTSSPEVTIVWLAPAASVSAH